MLKTESARGQKLSKLETLGFLCDWKNLHEDILRVARATYVRINPPAININFTRQQIRQTTRASIKITTLCNVCIHARSNRWYYRIAINLPTHWHYNLDSGSTYCVKIHWSTLTRPRDSLEFIDFFIYRYKIPIHYYTFWHFPQARLKHQSVCFYDNHARLHPMRLSLFALRLFYRFNKLSHVSRNYDPWNGARQITS